jgi:threonine/homoserine/homoserine lactone efflux protein
MKSLPRIFTWGMVISFLGSLPPGMMNIAAIQIEGEQGAGAAIIYAFGSMLAEVIIVRISLSGLNWLTRSRRLFTILEWMMAGLLIIFAAACFITADSIRDMPALLPGLLLPPFLTGVFLSVINPLHIPFWMGWSTVLLNKGVLERRVNMYNGYCLGIAIGTMAGFIVFIYGGPFLLKAFHSNQFFIQLVLGTLLLVIAFLLVKKMILVPASIRHARLLREVLIKNDGQL